MSSFLWNEKENYLVTLDQERISLLFRYKSKPLDNSIMNNTKEHKNRSVDHHSDNEDNTTPETIIIINCVLNAPLMLISILGNVLVLAAIIKTLTFEQSNKVENNVWYPIGFDSVVP